ncbi:hypothetical protein FHX58_002583 [Paraburkholderia tropica]|nr:hypothetical protein [Paraburkholderia tropica]
MNPRERHEHRGGPPERAERFDPAWPVFDHLRADRDVVAEHLGESRRVTRAAGPSQQRHLANRCVFVRVQTGCLRETRGNPTCTQRMIGWLPHAQIANESECLYRIKYSNRRLAFRVSDRHGEK